MKPASSMHERFTALTAPSASAGESRAAAWYDAEAYEILQRVTGLAKSDEFRRKEHDLGALFARLTVLESRVLHKRRSNPRRTISSRAHFRGSLPNDAPDC